ncbi:hypothetical protein D3C80_1265420 [compost metagenome]
MPLATTSKASPFSGTGVRVSVRVVNVTEVQLLVSPTLQKVRAWNVYCVPWYKLVNGTLRLVVVPLAARPVAPDPGAVPSSLNS